MLLSAEGPQASGKGARIRFGKGASSVEQGPFTPAESLIAGFWLIEAKSKDDAVAWFSRCPNPYEDSQGEIEICQAFGSDDFPSEIASEELKAQEQAMRDAASRLRGS